MVGEQGEFAVTPVLKDLINTGGKASGTGQSETGLKPIDAGQEKEFPDAAKSKVIGRKPGDRVTGVG